MNSSRASWSPRCARLGLVLLGLLLAELGVRVWLAAGGGPPGGPAAALRGAAAEVADHAPDLPVEADAEDGPGYMALHPFCGWGGKGFDERIARHAESFLEDDGGRLDLVIAGGSVAVFFVQNGSEDLIELLQADPRFAGREVRILNLASGALKQPQHLMRLALALNAGWRPEAVINLDGFNELVLSVQNVVEGVEPSYPSLPQWAPLMGQVASGPEFRQGIFEVMRERVRAAALASRFEGWGLEHSALAAQLAWLRMRSIRAAHVAAQGRFVAALASGETALPDARGFAPEDDELLDECARVWAESSRSMRALCAARSITYLHVLQPTLHDASSKPLTPEEIATGTAPAAWVHAVREGYPRLRAAGAGLRAEGLDFLDGSRAFAEEETTLYRDSCHFSAAGNRILAVLIARELLAELP